MIFRKGILPEWEDAANSEGGHFLLDLKPTAGPWIGDCWRNLVAAVIHESLTGADLITGVRLADKLSGKGKVTDRIKIELWYHSKLPAVGVHSLKQSLAECLGVTGRSGGGAAALKDKK